MKIRIRIKTSQRKIAINKKAFARLAREVLRKKGIKQAELSILFVGRQRIQALNKRFRNIDRPTDVLAFSMREGIDADLHPEILGDVVICPEMAQRFAKLYKNDYRKELYLDLIHGILHLLGYDDSKPKKRKLMQKEQTKILRKTIRKK